VILTDPKIKKLPEHIFLGLLIGGVSFGSQLIAASYLGAETPAIIGSICSIFVTVAYGKITSLRQEKVKEKIPLSSGSVVAAWSVYGLILVFIILTSPLFQLKEWLGDISVTVPFRLYDAVIQDYHIKSIKIAFLTDTWMLLFAGTLIGGLVQGAKLKIIFRILWDTVKQLKKTMVTVSSLIVMSSLLDHSGMIFQIGTALVVLTGTFYPLFAPLVGFLGTFLTGSDTSSNILFGKLQANVAQQLGVNGVTGGAADPAWLAAANSAGATGGKIISPQSIAVATSACDQQGREGEILKKALPYALVYVLICGLSVYFFK